jgi:hypothetical protein
MTISNQVYCNLFMSAWQTVPKSFSSSVMAELLRSSQTVGMTEGTLPTADLLNT